MDDLVDARTTLSEMTGITEDTIASIVYRDMRADGHFEALYRAVPTAFWLAPDADLSVPPQPEHSIVHAPTDVDRSARCNPPAVIKGRGQGAFTALVAAGPSFAAIAYALSGGQTDEAWWQPFGRVAASLIALPFTVLFGAVLGLVPIVLATLLLGEGGAHRHWLQRQYIWIGTGGVLGMMIAAMFQAPGLIGLSLVATAMLCAAIARHAVTWTDPDVA